MASGAEATLRVMTPSALTHLEQLMMMEAIHRLHCSTLDFIGMWSACNHAPEPDEALRQRLCRLFESPEFARLSPQDLLESFEGIRRDLAARQTPPIPERQPQAPPDE